MIFIILGEEKIMVWDRLNNKINLDFAKKFRQARISNFG